MIVMGIPSCGTYKKAVKWFMDHGIEIKTINLREQAPTKAEIKWYHEFSGQSIRTFLNTSGGLYRELDLKNKYPNMSLDELYYLLSKEPMLIKRPLIVDGSYVRTGFHEQEYTKKWL